uniref:hypothetical protein n=1 Tax=Shigella flexneri TaxID=623 RepID=UPI000A4A2A3D
MLVYDVVDNSTTDLRQGRVRIRYKYTPVPPLEDMELYQTFTDEYFEPAFAVLEVPDGCAKTSSLFYAVCGW